MGPDLGSSSTAAAASAGSSVWPPLATDMMRAAVGLARPWTSSGLAPSDRDVAVAARNLDTLTVLWHDGRGGFTREDVAVGSDPVAVVDDWSVTFVLNAEGYRTIGTLALPGGEPMALAAADLDGDCRDDLVVATKRSRQVGVLSSGG